MIMNHDREQNHCAPTFPLAVMKETEYSVIPTKPRDINGRQNSILSSFSAPHNDAGSAQVTKYSGTSAKEQLSYKSTVPAKRLRDDEKKFGENKFLCTENEKLNWCNNDLRSGVAALKARISQLTTDLNTEKSHSHTVYKDIVSKVIIQSAIRQGLHPDVMTSETVQAIWNAFNREMGTFEHPQTLLRSIGQGIQDLQKELMVSCTPCQLLEERGYNQGTELRKSLQSLELCQNEVRVLRNQVQALQKEMLAQVPKSEAISDDVFCRDFHALAASVKSLSRSVQVAQDVNILDTLEPIVLIHSVSEHHWNCRAGKKAYVYRESWTHSMGQYTRAEFRHVPQHRTVSGTA